MSRLTPARERQIRKYLDTVGDQDKRCMDLIAELDAVRFDNQFHLKQNAQFILSNDQLYKEIRDLKSLSAPLNLVEENYKLNERICKMKDSLIKAVVFFPMPNTLQIIGRALSVDDELIKNKG